MNIRNQNWMVGYSLLALLYSTDVGATDYMSSTEGVNSFRRSNQTDLNHRSSDVSDKRAITDDERKELKELFYADDFNLEKIETFLESRRIDFSLNEDKGFYEILEAANLGNPDLVKLLMNYGADINNSSSLGNNPLHVAMGFYQSRRMMKCLVECGADVNFRNSVGDNPMKYMIDSWKRSFNEEDIKFMVEHGMDINQTYFNGKSRVPLIYAMSWREEDDLIKCLIDNGADVNKAEANGNTPLMVASRNGHLKTVKLLLNGGNVENVMPLSTTYRNKHPLRKEQITSHRVKLVDINARNNEGKTALDLAREGDDSSKKVYETIENILLKYGAKTGAEIDRQKKSKLNRQKKSKLK